MPDSKRSKSLHDMVREAKQGPSPDTAFIPSVFSGDGKFKVGKVTESFYSLPASETKDKSGVFYAPFGSTPQAIAERAMAYGNLLAGRQKYVPWGLSHMKDIDQGWSQGVRRAVGARLMADSGVSEVADRTHFVVPQTSVYQWALEALQAKGSVQEMAVANEAKVFFRKHGYKKQAALLASSLDAVIEAAVNKEHLVPYLQVLQELFGTAYIENPESKDSTEIPDIPDDPEPEEWTERFPEKPEQPFQWGKMETVFPPLPNVATASGKKSKIWKRAAVGAFRYPWRALKTSDFQCFSIKRRVYGGTLLFDLSCSMHLQMSQIKIIMERSPEATMAAYGSLPESKYYGRLVIMAKNGRVADAATVRSLIGKGNVVDGPALEWLGKMPEPRIWVSDGKATGKGEYYDDTLWEVLIPRMVQERKIHQIPSATELIRLLKA